MSYKRIAAFFVALAVVALAVTSSVTAQEREAEVALQQAMHVEQVEGDLERAIELYRDIVEQHGDARAVAAKALLNLGQCYEKLGRTEAMNAYERLVTEYGEQSEVVAEARARLAALSREAPAAAPTGRVAKLIFTDEDTDLNHFFDMKPSPDGKRVAYTDMGYTGAVYVRDLASGDTTKVADGWATSPVWSSDGRKIAYGMVTSFRPRETTLAIVELSTGVSTTPPAVEGMSMVPIAWSPNEDLIACGIVDEQQNTVLVLVSLTTGDATTITNAHLMASADFSPDGEYLAFSDVVDGNRDIYVMAVASSERRRITVGPEEDGFPMWSPAGDMLLHSSENGTWVVPMRFGATSGPAFLVTSDTDVRPMGWTTGGQLHHVSYNIVRQFLRITADVEQMTEGGMLPLLPVTQKRVGGFAWSPDMKMVVRVEANTAHVHSLDDQQERSYPLGDEMFAGWVSWSSDGTEVYFNELFLSNRSEGTTLFSLDPATGAVRELFPRIKSINRLHSSPDGRRLVFYRTTEAGGSQLVVTDFGESEGRLLVDETDMDGGSLAGWAPPQLSPDGSRVLYGTQGDDWGEDDTCQLWMIAADGSNQRRIASARWIPSATWHPSGTHIAFNTWEENEMGPGRLFVVNLETGEQQEVTLPEGIAGMMVQQWSPDGKSIGVTAQSGTFEYWVVENVLTEGNGSR